MGGQPDESQCIVYEIKISSAFRCRRSIGKNFYPASEISNGKSFIQIENPWAGLRLFDITDPTSVTRIEGTLTTTLDAIVPQLLTPEKFLHQVRL